MSYPEGFADWPDERRNEFFAAEARAYDERQKADVKNSRHARDNGNGADDTPPDQGAPPIGEDRPKPNFRSLADFCAEFRPISYAVAGLMREGSLYTLTGRTGEGKTAFLVILALAIATGLGEQLIGRKVKKGRVAFCTAENPDDLRMRLMIACWTFNIDVLVIDRDMLISDNRVARRTSSDGSGKRVRRSRSSSLILGKLISTAETRTTTPRP